MPETLCWHGIAAGASCGKAALRKIMPKETRKKAKTRMRCQVRNMRPRAHAIKPPRCVGPELKSAWAPVAPNVPQACYTVKPCWPDC